LWFLGEFERTKAEIERKHADKKRGVFDEIGELIKDSMYRASTVHHESEKQGANSCPYLGQTELFLVKFTYTLVRKFAINLSLHISRNLTFCSLLCGILVFKKYCQ